MDFSNILDGLLRDRKITAYRLAKDLGLSESMVANWRCGKQMPSYKSINLLCEYFNVSADYLLGRTTDLKPYGTYTEIVPRSGAERESTVCRITHD